MRKRRPDRDRATAGAPTEDLAAIVQRVARSIDERLEIHEPGLIAEDEEFVEMSDLLVPDNVPLELVERVSRSTFGLARAMGHRALARREAVSEEWVSWAFDRLTSTVAAELQFLLEAIERHVEPPLIARVLAEADDDWTWGWCYEVVTDFVRRRVEAGELPGVADFDRWVDAARTDTADAFSGLEGVLPASTVRDFDSWREQHGRLGTASP